MSLLEIIYVVIMILLLVGVFGSATSPNSFPWWPVANPIVYFILFVIIGLVLWGPFPARGSTRTGALSFGQQLLSPG